MDELPLPETLASYKAALADKVERAAAKVEPTEGDELRADGKAS